MFNWSSVVFAFWIVFWIYWYISARRTHSQTKRREPFTSRWLSWLLYFSGYIVLLGNPGTFGPLSSRFLPGNLVLRLIGLVILLSGLGFAVWARVHLGQYWSGRVSIKIDHKLIRTGPYRIVRHPIYTGILFGFVGSAITIGEIRAWLAFALVLTGLLMKIRTEEKFMLEEFGPGYIQYKKAIKMLIPFIV